MNDQNKIQYFKKNMAMVKRSLAYVRKVSPNFILITALSSIFNAMAGYVGIYMTAFILNELTGDRDVQRLIFLVALTIGLQFVMKILTSAFSRIGSLRTFKFWQDFGMPMNMAVASFDYKAMEDPETHKKVDYYLELLIETGGGPGQLAWFISSSIYNITNIIMAGIILVEIAAKGFFVHTSQWYLSWPVSVIALIAIIVIAAYRIRTSARTTRKSQEAVEDKLVYSRIMKYYMEDYLSNYHSGKDIRLYNEEDVIIDNIGAEISSAEKVMRKITGNNLFSSFISTVSFSAEDIIVTLLIGLRSVAGIIGVGEVIKAVSGVSNAISGVSELVASFARVFVNNRSMEAYFAVMDTPNTMQQGTKPVTKNSSVSEGQHDYEIEFRDVSFKYPKSDRYALKNVSLKLHIGERLAVVGMNGSGKTTFIKLLCRLYDPTEGVILLNGTDIREYDYEEYLSLFSVVFQDFNLFAVTIGQNITASFEYDREKVKRCLEEVGMGKRFSEMPDGTDTYLYKNFEDFGVEISGGEAQKIALARALYKESPFIVLDEPTAALDPIAEFDIYSKFNEIVKEKTAVYISHRLSSCRFCDEILVFDDGQFIEKGTHDKLVSEEGKYREMWISQAQYYVDNTR